MNRLPEEYLEGLRLFNAGEFFACHDVLEELWTESGGDEKEFYQGLIHAAVSLFHFETGNLGGARKMYVSARRYLQPYRPRMMGVDLDAFLEDYQACFQELLDASGEYPSRLTLDPEKIPAIPLPKEAQSE